MAALVVLAVVVALFCLGVAIVAAVLLKRAAGGLREQVRTSSDRFRPLLDELSAESAVSATELDHLRRRLDDRSAHVPGGPPAGDTGPLPG